MFISPLLLLLLLLSRFSRVRLCVTPETAAPRANCFHLIFSSGSRHLSPGEENEHKGRVAAVLCDCGQVPCPLWALGASKGG